MEMDILDYTLAPAGILIMVIYHLWLLHRIIYSPTITVLGINAISRRAWVRSMMEDKKNGILAVQTLRNNIMASTLIASTMIMLSAGLAVIVWNGQERSPAATIKYLLILLCFLLAFMLSVQSIRYFSHASVLINVPSDMDTPQRTDCVSWKYVAGIVSRGSYFWSLGLRALYFSFPVLFWTFGAIHMLLCCLLMVVVLYFLDFTSDFAAVHSGEDRRSIPAAVAAV